MTVRANPAFLAIFLVVLAPVGAAVLVATLLLLGIEPRIVFAPGRAVKSLLEVCGFHVANRSGGGQHGGLLVGSIRSSRIRVGAAQVAARRLSAGGIGSFARWSCSVGQQDALEPE